MTCKNCTWFVEETESIGDYQHEEAKRRKKGFCLIKDLFTEVKPYRKACKDFNFDGVKEDAETESKKRSC